MTTTSNMVYSTFTGWIDPPTDVRPPLTEDLTCQVAVIGGGLAGMSTALRLAERGVDTVLLEAEFCGYGSASRNAGQLASAPGGDIQLLNLFFRKRTPAIIRLTENAAHHVEDLIETLGIDCDYEPTGNVFTPVSRGQMGRVRRVAKILRGAGAHVEEGSSRELGVPHGFVGGLREVHGGIMNPGKFTRGLRGAVLSSSARVFEQSKVADIARDGAGVVVSTPRGVVRAQKVVLATNAFAGEWDIAPKRLSSPMWVVEVADVAVERAWGGWIAITSTWLPIAGKIGDDVFYSVACNGHGLAQAPYLGSLIADLIVTGTPADDLRTVWIEEPKFARPMMMGRFGLRTVWVVDRVNDLINGSRRNARKGFTAAQFRRLPSRPS